MTSAPDRIIIFDTTLRDGEQSPGFSMNLEEKLMVADLLDHMGVDVIEAGFAMASDGDFASVKAIAERTKQAVVCSLARAKKADIERAAAAVKPAKRPRIHTFMSTSDIHLKYQFQKSQEEVLEMIRETVALARNYTDDVEWSAMDATRTGHDYLAKAVETAIKAGATTINLPDTVGYATPEDITAMFTAMISRVPNADKAIFSFHGQNDLGLATANTLAAVRAGARQVELTINGIGERAGNTALEEVVMTLKTRPANYGVTCNVDTTYITRASRLIQSITGHAVQPNKAIVGANAFAHESGIHQDGVLKHAETYEIMTPESVGLTRSHLVLGKHSGRHAFKDRLQELGFTLGDNALEDAFERFKALADKKKEIFDADLIALVDAAAAAKEDNITLSRLRVSCGTEGEQVAEMSIKQDGTEKSIRTEGIGSVDAIFKAIRELIPHQAKLQLYQVHAVTQGTDAQAEVTVRLVTETGQLANGHGVDADTLTASAKAYLNALNHLMEAKHEPKISLISDQ
jgi:2-isopropylmalate synthase